MRKIITLLLILNILFFTPGCWDLRDINDTAFVLGIGIDSPTNPDTAKYNITFEFARPITTHENPEPQTLVVSTDADGIVQAIQRIQTTVSRKISLSHLRIVAIGEGIAKQENFKDITNYLLRDPDVALQLRLVFAQNALAKDLFYTKHRFEERFSSELVQMGLLQKEIALVRTNNFLDFLTDLNRTDGIAIGSRVYIQKGENVITRDGAVVYKDWKLLAWLNAEEAQAANLLIEKTQAVILVNEEKNTFSYRIRKMDTKVKPSFEGGKPSFRVNVTTEGMIIEESGKEIDLSKPDNLQDIEALLAQAISQQVNSAIEKSQKEIKVDYLGFEKAFEKYQSKAFKSLNWNKIYPNIPIEVEVDCKVKAFGLRK
jgi:spore germination protein KC